MPCLLCNSLQGLGRRLTNEEYFQSSNLPTRNFEHKDIPSTYFVSSAETCYCCCILLKGVNGYLQQCEHDFNLVAQVSFLFLYSGWDGEIKNCDKVIKCTFMDETEIFIEFFTLEDGNRPCPDAWDDVPTGVRTSPGTRSEEAFEKAREWLRECESEYHGNELLELEDPTTYVNLCAASQQVSPSLPTRIVDVGRHDGKIKVIRGAGKAHRYLCLSHCWGPQQIITTTKATLRERMHEIDDNELSVTFRDAIWMTRRFGIDYIWIDSLCIVQDDPADWELESAKMASIYHNAYLTIAATKSSSGAGGLFSKTPDFEVAGTTPAGEGYCLVFRERIDHAPPLNTSTASRFPLMARAWAFQERMLSPRILHFGYHELFFECSSGSDCECGNIGFLGHTDDIPLPTLRDMYSFALESTLRLRSGEQSNKKWIRRMTYFIGPVWRSLVMLYSALDLTVVSDRLPAISGVAKTFAEKTESPYLAGLFKDTLIDDLLWMTSNYEKPRLVEWRAPSWSWASIGTPVDYEDCLIYYHEDIHRDEPNTRIEFVTINDSEITPAGLDDFGRVKHGSLTLTSQLLPVTLVLSPNLDRLRRPIYSIRIGNGDLAPRIWPDYNLSHDGPYQVLPGTKVFCLRMIEETESKVAISLVLRAAPDDTGNQFERIGCLRIDPLGRVEHLKNRDLIIEALNEAEVKTIKVI
ncbi:heterokaryon incompatibility protein-domain-containing protein [Xylaria scruposa]|nr:heterokaryon incompatibility protein-domain-containing protein [Xylaria scruposa]